MQLPQWQGDARARGQEGITGEDSFEIGQQLRAIDGTIPRLNLPMRKLGLVRLDLCLVPPHELVERCNRNAEALCFLQPPFLVGQRV